MHHSKCPSYEDGFFDETIFAKATLYVNSNAARSFVASQLWNKFSAYVNENLDQNKDDGYVPSKFDAIYNGMWDIWDYCNATKNSQDSKGLRYILHYTKEEDPDNHSKQINVFHVGVEGFSDLSLERLIMQDSIPWDSVLPKQNPGAKLPVFHYVDECFAGSKNIRYVEFGRLNTVHRSNRFGSNNIFKECDNLSEIVFRDVADVGRNMIYGCKGLKTLTFRKGFTTINDYSFQDCPQLKEINILPNNIKWSEIGDNCFNRCKSLEKVDLTNAGGLKTGASFWYNTSLKEVILPADIRQIGIRSFYGCGPDLKFSIKDNSGTCKVVDNVVYRQTGEDLNGIWSYVYADSLTIPEGVTGLYSTFYENARIKTVKLPQSLTVIGEETFSECINLQSVNIPHSVLVLEAYAFEECDRLEEIKIPDAIDTVPKLLCYSCDALKSIELGSNLQYIDRYAFTACENVNVLTVKAPIPPETYDNDVFSCYSTATLRVPAKSYNYYKVVPPWNQFKKIETIEPGGIDDVEADPDTTDPVWIGLDGKRADANNLTPGIYVRIRSGKATKEIIR